MAQVAQVSIQGLFGHADHLVRFRRGEPTIVLGPNGAGKTHVLRLTAAALSLDAPTLLSSPFHRLGVRFVDGRELSIEQTRDDSHVLLRVRALPADTGESGLVITSEDLEALDRRLPREIRRVAQNKWVDDRTGRFLSNTEIKRRYGTGPDPVTSRLSEHPQVAEMCGPPQPVFIDTWRLDSRAEDTGLPGEWRRTTSSAASRIRAYTEHLGEEITEARRSSIHATQSADLSFAARALSAANLSVNELQLHERYDRTVQRYEALARNGLAVGDAPIAFPERTTPTVRRILSVFLDDWDQRLKPLLPVNEKLDVLRAILDLKLRPSGKRTAISGQGVLEFYNAAEQRLPVSRLSSGEQHLVALFTLLLFAAKRGSLVLIDEPEISLHAAWKHAFLHDISLVADINDLQVVVATHSAGIVNGRWDLVEELELSSVGGVDQASAIELDEDEDEDIDD